MELVLPNGVDRLTQSQKIIAGGLGIGGLWFVASLMPPLTVLLSNLVGIAILGVIALIFTWMLTNPWIVWGLLKSISWHITKGLISLAPLEAQERYLDWLKSRGNLIRQSQQALAADALGQRQKIDEAEKNYQKHMREYDRATTAGNTLQAQAAWGKANQDKNYFETMLPLCEMTETREKLLRDAFEAFSAKQEEIGYSVSLQRKQYKTLEDTRKGMLAANEALVDAGQLQKIFDETNEQIMLRMNQMTVEINQFELNLQPILQGHALNKAELMQAGELALAEFRAGKTSIS
jgi:hypothetical protein